MKKLPIVIVLFITIAITACDPATNYRQVIDNQTSHDIKIALDSGYMVTGHDTLNILKESETALFLDGGYNGTTEFETCPGYYFTAENYLALIANDSSLNLDPILELAAKWEFNVIEEKGDNEYDCECVLTITESDIN